jgi:hypothetical protein
MRVTELILVVNYFKLKMSTILKLLLPYIAIATA